MVSLRVDSLRVFRVDSRSISRSSCCVVLASLTLLVPPAAIAGAPPTDLCGSIATDTVLRAEESPFLVSCDLLVEAAATLRIEPGVEIRVAGGVEIRIEGRILAEGNAERPITIAGDGVRWRGIDIDHAGTGATRDSLFTWVRLRDGERLVEIDDTGASPIIFESCAFDNWSSKALVWHDANGLRVSRTSFGTDTSGSRNSETINGYGSSAIIEHCVFGARTGYNDILDLADASWGGPVPIVRYNTFLGGEDDAIDFDNCDGWIVGNLIENYRPAPGSTSSANGGGITGSDGSRPVVLGNIVYRSFHGIGFKDGVDALVVGNLVTECHVGLTLYRARCSEPDAHANLRNNIVWNNHHFETGEPQNIVLNGRWWDDYCQLDEPQGTLEASHNLVEGGWAEGVANLDLDPRLVSPATGDFRPGPDSPALDAGSDETLSFAGVDAAELAAALDLDRDGNPRADLPCIANSGHGARSYVDIGPFETQPPGPCDGAPRFLRGDANGDGSANISDAVRILLELFGGAATGDCQDASDVDDDGEIRLTDAVALLSFLFRSGASPAPPWPTPGEDPSADELTCERRTL